MRLIVIIYKGILILWLGVVVIGASFAASTAVLHQSSGGAFQGWTLGYVLVGVVAAVMSVGLLATIISIHDRLVEVRSEITRLTDSIEQSKSTVPHQ